MPFTLFIKSITKSDINDESKQKLLRKRWKKFYNKSVKGKTIYCKKERVISPRRFVVFDNFYGDLA